MSVSSSKYGQQDAEGQCTRGSWLWRMLEAMKTAFPTPAPTFAEELRADRLLRANLTPEQRDQYGKDKSLSWLAARQVAATASLLLVK